MKNQNYINHIVFLVDRSGSIGSVRGLSQQIVQVFDSQIKHLALRSKELDQETRVSVYLFNEKSDCIIYDKDVMRLPSLASHYSIMGGTALIDASIKAIDELAETPQRYGDHAFLLYALTDGQERDSYNSASLLAEKIAKLPDNWTMAVLVPDQHGVFEAKKFGFPVNNISVWSTTSDGAEKVGETMKVATDNFMRARATGTRSTKNLFNLDVSKIPTTAVKTKLDELKPSVDFDIFPVHNDAIIKDYVEAFTKEPYRLGSAYYQLSKKETVQGSKNIAIQDTKNGRVYSGPAARDLLKLPSHEIKVDPINFGNYRVFIQSTAPNRKLIRGTQVLVMK